MQGQRLLPAEVPQGPKSYNAMVKQEHISDGQVGGVLQMPRPTPEQGLTEMCPVLLCGCELGQTGQEVVPMPTVWTGSGSSLQLRAE